MLSGAVQPFLDCVLADFNWFAARRKQQCHAVFAWFDRVLGFRMLLNVFLYAGAFGFLSASR